LKHPLHIYKKVESQDNGSPAPHSTTQWLKLLLMPPLRLEPEEELAEFPLWESSTSASCFIPSLAEPNLHGDLGQETCGRTRSVLWSALEMSNCRLVHEGDNPNLGALVLLVTTGALGPKCFLAARTNLAAAIPKTELIHLMGDSVVATSMVTC
jgi:hypothetical protein